MPLILAPRKQKQMNLCEFEINLVCKEFRTARTVGTTQLNPVLKNKNKTK